MYEYFGGVAKILVPDNCKTAVDHNNGWKDQRINAVYHEMAEHYGTAVIPARVRAPKDKPNAEGSVGQISTWITAALRNEQFFSLWELNQAIRKKLEEFSRRPFQKKEGSRYEIFHDEELPPLAPLPAHPYELAEWKQATVQFNYHISFDGMMYSVPYEYIKRKVDVRVTDKTVEIFYNQNRIASHRRLYGLSRFCGCLYRFFWCFTTVYGSSPVFPGVALILLSNLVSFLSPPHFTVVLPSNLVSACIPSAGFFVLRCLAIMLNPCYNFSGQTKITRR